MLRTTAEPMNPHPPVSNTFIGWSALSSDRNALGRRAYHFAPPNLNNLLAGNRLHP
jgi:CHASE2 domain-containing sensor protein